MSVTDIPSTQLIFLNVTSTNGETDFPSDIDIFSDPPRLQLSVSVYWLLFYIVVYGIIFLGSIVGNQLVIWSYIIEPKLRRPTNTFIVSLAVADFITGLFGIPTAVFGRLFKGPYVCYAATRPYLFFVTFTMCAVSMLHLVLITIDRYIAVTKPLKYRAIMTTRRCRILIALGWLIGVSFGAAPVVAPSKNPTRWVCGITKYEESAVSFHRLGSVAVIPVCLFILCLIYIRIYAVVRRHVKEKSERIKSQTQSHVGGAGVSMYHTTVTTAIILAAFTICWLPTTAKFALEIFVTTTLEKTFLYQTAAEVLNLGNSMINPIIYGYRNDLFRSTYKLIIRGACFCLKSLERETNVAKQNQSKAPTIATLTATA